MTTAPNSLKALAMHMIMPTSMARRHSGRVTRKKVAPGPAPRERETFSRRKGTLSKPALAVLM